MPRQDPRIDDSPGTAAEQIQDRNIRHLLFLTRLGTQEANQVDEQLKEEVLPEIEDQVAAQVNRLDTSEGLTAQKARQLEQFGQSLASSMTTLMATVRTGLIRRLVDIAQSETQFQHGLFRKSIPVDWQFSVPSDDQLAQFVESQPFDGKPLSEWFTDLDTGTASRLNQQIRRGMSQGESMDEIMRRIRGTRRQNFTDGELFTTRRHAQALARSGVIHASNQATNSFYQENDDIIKGVNIVVTLDTRTCPTCAGYEDGNPWPMDGHPTPPFHPNCRCTTTPVLRSWKELGLDVDEVPASTRASMNGQVPEDMTYNQWLRRRVQAGDMEAVEEALGKTRAKLFAGGGLDVGTFTDRRGRVLNLEQLKRRERDVFEALGE